MARTPRHDAHTDKSNRPDDSPATATDVKWWAKYVDGATVLALLTAGTYFIGWSYFQGYFFRLSIPTEMVELTTSAYMRIAMVPTLFFYSTLYGAWWAAKQKPQTYVTSLIANLPLALLLLILVTRAADATPGADRQLRETYAWTVGGALLALWTSRTNVIWLVARSGKTLRAFALAFAILMLPDLAASFGRLHAVMRAEGYSRDAVMIRFGSDRAELRTLASRTPIVVWVQGDRYFLVPLQRDAPARMPTSLVNASEIYNVSFQRVRE